MAVAERLLDNTGVVFGTASPLLAGLVQPLTVCVTEYVPPVVTVIELVVCPVFHKNVAPETPVADNTELPQLLTTLSSGAGVLEADGDTVTDEDSLVHPFAVWVTE